MNDTMLVGGLLVMLVRVGCAAVVVAVWGGLALSVARFASSKWHPDRGSR